MWAETSLNDKKLYIDASQLVIQVFKTYFDKPKTDLPTEPEKAPKILIKQPVRGV